MKVLPFSRFPRKRRRGSSTRQGRRAKTERASWNWARLGSRCSVGYLFFELYSSSPLCDKWQQLTVTHCCTRLLSVMNNLFRPHISTLNFFSKYFFFFNTKFFFLSVDICSLGARSREAAASSSPSLRSSRATLARKSVVRMLLRSVPAF